MGLPPLDYPTLLELLALIGAGKLSGDALKDARRRIREFLARKEYGFTPEPELATELQHVNSSELLRRFKACVGNHPYSSLIKLGLTIQHLYGDGQDHVIRRTKDKVYNNPKYGAKGITVLNMGSTGALPEIIRYLSDTKIENNYSVTAMSDIFDEIITDWDSITIFHQTSHGAKDLGIKIIGYMNQSKKLFFVFAGGIAAIQAMKKIADISNKKETRKRGYMLTLIGRRIMGEEEDRKLLAWVFEKV